MKKILTGKQLLILGKKLLIPVGLVLVVISIILAQFPQKVTIEGTFIAYMFGALLMCSIMSYFPKIEKIVERIIKHII